MKTTLLLAALFAATTFSFGQHPTCDGSRYLNPTYSVDQTLDIQYGSNTTVGGSNQDLFLDFFEPSGDVATARPLIILAFGGSFIGGTRDDMHPFCEYYASHGYACATIDYRLYDGPLFPLPDSTVMTDEVIKALGDMKAAIRFFKEDAANANTYRVDPDYIIVGGISAGGIVAAHAGMLDSTDVVEPYILPLVTNNGGWEGNSSANTQYDSEVLAVLNYSGALRRTDYIDPTDVPIFSVHDDNDGTVPYAFGYASIATFPIISMEGSFLIDQKAQAEGVTSELITYANSSGHVSYFSANATTTDTILQRSLEFLYPQVCNASVSIDPIEAPLDFSVYPNPAQTEITINVKNGSDYVVNISDLAGRLTLSKSITAGENKISVESFNSGVYLIEVIDQQNGKSQLKRLVVE